MQVAIKYNTSVDVYFRMIKRGAVDFAVSGDWTPASGDVKVSIDGAAQANTTNLPSNITGALWRLTLTAAETVGKIVCVSIIDSATKAVEDQALDFYTYGNASAAVTRDIGATIQQADVRQWIGTNVATPTVAGIPTATLANPAGIQRNAAYNNWTFVMKDSSDHITPKTGLTVTVQVSLDGAAFTNATNTPATEVGSGLYKINLAAADLNGQMVAIKYTATGADTVIDRLVTEPI